MTNVEKLHVIAAMSGATSSGSRAADRQCRRALPGLFPRRGALRGRSYSSSATSSPIRDADRLLGASLTVRAGERVGLTGLFGGSRPVATLGRVIVGAHSYQSRARSASTGKAIAAARARPDAALARQGSATIPEDRWL